MAKREGSCISLVTSHPESPSLKDLKEVLSGLLEIKIIFNETWLLASLNEQMHVFLIRTLTFLIVN